MNAIVVFESVYGNTRAIAEAIAEGLGGVPAVPVSEAADQATGVWLLVVGGPTHMHGLTTTRSRVAATEAAQKDGAAHIDPSATAEPGLREWLRDLAPGDESARAAAFDTRLDRSSWLTGAACRGIAKRLRQHGYGIVGMESFLVQDSEGPLEEGELERARAWGAELAELTEIAATGVTTRAGP